MKIEIVGAQVLLGRGSDKISLLTKLPCPYTLEGSPSQELLSLDFDASRDTGVEYCLEHLKIKPEVIDVRM